MAIITRDRAIISVKNQFINTLGRLPYPQELDAFVRLMTDGGWRPENVRDELMASPAFRSKTLGQGMIVRTTINPVNLGVSAHYKREITENNAAEAQARVNYPLPAALKTVRR